MILNRGFGRNKEDERQRLFLVIVNGIQLLTNGLNAEQAIINAKVWAELEGRETFKLNFTKRADPCKCECEDDEDECECEERNAKRVPTEILITEASHHSDKINLSYFEAVYIVTPPEATKKAKRKYTKRSV